MRRKGRISELEGEEGGETGDGGRGRGDGRRGTGDEGRGTREGRRETEDGRQVAGVRWQEIPVKPVVFQMTKFDIEKLTKAYNGE
jgi:hypothetical protein